MPLDLPHKIMPVPATALKFHTNAEIDEVSDANNKVNILSQSLTMLYIQIYNTLTKRLQSGVTRPLAYRRKQLLQLARMIQDNHTAIEDALLADLNKPRMETTAAEVSHVITSVLNAAENLEQWAAPEACPTKEAWRSSWGATLYKEPKGVVLIISYVLLSRP